jgi:DNA-binding GntR family transcriptional regulator
LEYEPSKTISEEMLTSELGISRTPLRQALYRLELEGLVIRQSNGRMHVAPMSTQEAEKIFLVREVLEGLVAREATHNITQDQIVRLEDILQLMERAARDNRIHDAIRYGSEFHNLLYEPSRNQTAVDFLNQIKNRLERYRRLGGIKNPRYEPLLPVKEHRDILQAIKAGDAETAEQCMRSHIRRSLSVTIETIHTVLGSLA